MISEAAKWDAVYARYSSHKQDEGTSIDVQLESCRRAAGGPCREYVDKARTGRSIAGRVQLLRLIADAEAGKVARLFVYKFDRLGRAAETHSLVADLEDLGVEVISATEGKEALSRGVQLVVAEHYSKALAERTHAGLMNRFQNHQWTGGNPSYGLKVLDDDGQRKLAVNPEEAEIVKLVVHWYLSDNVGVKEIACRLRDKAVPTRKGAPWSFTSVRRILINPATTGHIHFNMRRMRLDKTSGRRVPKFKDAKDVVSYQDEKLRIISDADFVAIKAKLGQRSQAGRTARPSSQVRPFSGLIFCGECGRPFYGRRSLNRKGDYRYYSCSTRTRLGAEACSCSAVVREDSLIERVQQALSFAFEDVEAIVEAAVEEAARRLGTGRAEAARMRQEMKGIENEIASLGKELVNPDADPAAKKAILGLMGEAQQKRERLERVARSLAERADEGTEQIPKTVRNLLQEAQDNLLAIATPTQFNRFVEDFIGPMEVTADGAIRPMEGPEISGEIEPLDPRMAWRLAFWERFLGMGQQGE